MAEPLKFVPALVWVVRVVVGGLFVFAGVQKAMDAQQFALDIQNYQLTTWTVSILSAIYLPWLEIFAGLALVSARTRRGGLLIITLLMIVFTIALALAAARGLDITCGCFGRELSQTDFPTLFLRDGLILAGCAGLWWAESSASRRSRT